MSRFISNLNSDFLPEISERILSEVSSDIKGNVENLRVEFDNSSRTENPSLQLILRGDITVHEYENIAAASKWFETVRWDGEKAALKMGLTEPKKVEVVKKNQPLRTVFSIQLSSYPACCAMHQANYFQVDHRASQELVDLIMNMVLKAYKDTFTFRPNRWIFNFVERNNQTLIPRKNNTQKMVTPIEVEDHPEIDYPKIYDWAKRQAGYQEMLCYNANSGHVIHTALVVPSNQE